MGALCTGSRHTGGVNISVRVAKRPFAPTAPERRSAATEYLMGEYTTRNNYCELTALKFRRPIALLSWKTTQTGRADSIAPGDRGTDTSDILRDTSPAQRGHTCM